GGENEVWLLTHLKSHPKQGRGEILKAAEAAGKNQGSIGLLLVKLAKDGKIAGVLPAGASRGLLYSLA
ncbi:MAG: hypothetical protein NTW19_01825, partial [Planctomycetota bacterium]|nr:hypothetical protein [Planctomycetota bacterium]